MRYILLITLFFITSCSITDKGRAEKLLTINIPSTNRLVKAGTPLSSKTKRVTDLSTKTEYNVIERLYNTTWYQTEKEYDDGKLEYETEFVIFNSSSSVVEREMKNGRMERIERDDYKKLIILSTTIAGITDLNAAVVQSVDGDGDKEYEGYWLKDEHNLFIVEGRNKADVQRRLELIIQDPMNSLYFDTEKYLLSTKK
ncbi:MAG: hypothetical protein ACRCTJ_07635 [Brevinema sp.]